MTYPRKVLSLIRETTEMEQHGCLTNQSNYQCHVGLHLVRYDHTSHAVSYNVPKRRKNIMYDRILNVFRL